MAFFQDYAIDLQCFLDLEQIFVYTFCIIIVFYVSYLGEQRW